MRLGQLARKLDKKPQELVEFLEKEHQISIDSDLNTKLEKTPLDLVMKAYTPETEKNLDLPESSAEIETEKEEIKDQKLSEEAIEDMAAEAVIAEINEESTEATLEPEALEIEEGEEQEDELPELIVEDGVIKAPKPELDGPKVVGKIELPAIKRSTRFLVTKNGNTVDVTEEIHDKRKADREARKKKAIEAKKQRRVKQQKKRSRKVMSDTEKKAHEVKIATKRKAEQEKKRQEKRKAHYFNNVQQKTAKQSAIKKKKEIEKAAKKQKAPKLPEPTTLWGRFKRWLNT